LAPKIREPASGSWVGLKSGWAEAGQGGQRSRRGTRRTVQRLARFNRALLDERSGENLMPDRRAWSAGRPILLLRADFRNRRGEFSPPGGWLSVDYSNTILRTPGL
jgi:hypothetical protein